MFKLLLLMFKISIKIKQKMKAIMEMQLYYGFVVNLK